MTLRNSRVFSDKKERIPDHHGFFNAEQKRSALPSCRHLSRRKIHVSYEIQFKMNRYSCYLPFAPFGERLPESVSEIVRCHLFKRYKGELCCVRK